MLLDNDIEILKYECINVLHRIFYGFHHFFNQKIVFTFPLDGHIYTHKKSINISSCIHFTCQLVSGQRHVNVINSEYISICKTSYAEKETYALWYVKYWNESWYEN